MAKIGRPKNIPTPDIMWDLFQEYRNKTKHNPVLVQDYVGKLATEVERKRERPLTMEGFENYLADKGVLEDAGDYFKNKENRYEEFAPICSRIKRLIRQDQIEGGMVGIYNPSITQRLNNLVERQEVASNVKASIDIDYTKYTDDELRILAELQSKGRVSET